MSGKKPDLHIKNSKFCRAGFLPAGNYGNIEISIY